MYGCRKEKQKGGYRERERKEVGGDSRVKIVLGKNKT